MSEFGSNTPANDVEGQTHYEDGQDLRFVPPPTRISVPLPYLITPAGRDLFLSGERTKFEALPNTDDAFLFYSCIVHSKIEEFFSFYKLMTEAAQWHSAVKDHCRDYFVLRILPDFSEPIMDTPADRIIGGFTFTIPVQFQPMPDGFAFLVHQEIFRVQVQDERQPDNVDRQVAGIRERNERLGFQMPSVLRAVSQFQSNSIAYQEQITIMHDNTGSGATPKLLAREYEINLDTMHHHLDEAIRRGVINQKKNFSTEEVERLRPFLNVKVRSKKPPQS